LGLTRRSRALVPGLGARFPWSELRRAYASAKVDPALARRVVARLPRTRSRLRAIAAAVTTFALAFVGGYTGMTPLPWSSGARQGRPAPERLVDAVVPLPPAAPAHHDAAPTPAPAPAKRAQPPSDSKEHPP
jgi:hypothetical protein